ncbi:MAG: hypothetical protein IKD23_06465 [Lentisphaeria bacterium]|nr:hypothetical protein [Lentisphaeria bacterium]
MLKKLFVLLFAAGVCLCSSAAGEVKQLWLENNVVQLISGDYKVTVMPKFNGRISGFAYKNRQLFSSATSVAGTRLEPAPKESLVSLKLTVDGTVPATVGSSVSGKEVVLEREVIYGDLHLYSRYTVTGEGLVWSIRYDIESVTRKPTFFYLYSMSWSPKFSDYAYVNAGAVKSGKLTSSGNRVIKDDMQKMVVYDSSRKLAVLSEMLTPIPGETQKNLIWDHKTYHKYFIQHKRPGWNKGYKSPEYSMRFSVFPAEENQWQEKLGTADSKKKISDETIAAVPAAAQTESDPVLKGKGFEDIRAAAAKCEIYSDEDHALGAKLIARMKEMALARKAVFSPPRPVMEGVVYRYGRLYYTENSWNDRQLFVDRTLWEPGSLPFKKKSIKRTFEIMSGYGAGLSYFYSSNYNHIFYECAKDIPGFQMVPTLFLERRPQLSKKYLQTLADSPNAMKVDGKSIIMSYGCDRSLSPDQFNEYVEKLQKDTGRDDFTIIAEFTENCHRKNCNWNYKELNWPSVYYRKTGKVSARHLLFFFDLLSEYLKNAGGVDLAVYAGESDFSMSYRTFDELLLPLCGAACAQEGFDGKKLLVLQIMYGYSTPHGAQTLSADGTLTARKYLELCKKYKVDIPMGFEWDELNEATNWEPTVARPMALRRIYDHYMWGKPAVLPGDDSSIPNFIVSHRRQLAIGSMLKLEILNLPDGVNNGKYSCVLELLDQDRKVRWTSEMWEFQAEKAGEKTFDLESDKFADASLLTPRLTVLYKGKKMVLGEGLPYVVLTAGACVDQTWFATPLRNILPLEGKITLKEVGKLAPGVTEFEADVNVKAKEKITVAEAVQNSLSVFAYDGKNEYLQNDPERYLYKINYRYINNPYKQVIRITSAVSNAPSLIGFSFNGFAYGSGSSPVELAKQFPGSIPEYKLANGVMVNYQLFSVKKTDIGNAVLKFTGKRVDGPTKGADLNWEVPLKDIGSFGIVSHVFEDGLAISVERHYRHSHLPLLLDSNELNFRSKVICDTHDSVIAMRLISENGKVYWSYGTVPQNDRKEKGNVSIGSYCEKRGAISVDIPAKRLPDINYCIDPAKGHSLTCDAGREYYAQMGSFISIVSGFEGSLASWHTIPHIHLSRKKDQLNTPVPAFVKENDGKWALDFDGKSGNFLALPANALTQRSSFRLSLEIMPRELSREQIIFRQYGPAYQTGFGLSVQKGELVVTFRYRDPIDNTSGTKVFHTGLKLTEGVYQKLELSFNGRDICAAVNDKKVQFTSPGIPYWATASSIGGDFSKGKDGNVLLFNGRIKSIKISRIPDESLKKPEKPVILPDNFAVKCGDLQVSVGKNGFWTIRQILFKGQEVTTPKSWYGTVTGGQPGIKGWVGSGHMENGIGEKDVKVSFKLNGKDWNPVAGVTEAESFSCRKESVLGFMYLTYEYTFSGNTLTEKVKYRMLKRGAIYIYHFMMPWERSFTEYLFKNSDGEVITGQFKGNEEQLIWKKPLFFTAYSPAKQVRITAELQQPFALSENSYIRLHDRNSFHKYYFVPDSRRKVDAGIEYEQGLVTRFFQCDAEKWKSEKTQLQK